MQKINLITSRVLLIPHDNIDTDQIIPARFLKGVHRSGMGAHLFADWRYSADGLPNPDFILNQPKAMLARILLTGDNFGCGSSREHAVWSLLDYGFKAVISTSFADIFRNNALRNGLLPIRIDAFAHQGLVELIRAHPKSELSIDLEHQVVRNPADQEIHFPIDPFIKLRLLHGHDELDYLLSLEDRIQEYETRQESDLAG